MYRGSHPTEGVERQPSPPAEMLAVDMNRLPSVPSGPAPPQPFASYGTHQRYTVAPSQPDMFPPSRHHPPRDPDGGQHNAPQLPSLRSLLERELLDTKPSDPPSRSGGGHVAHGSAGRYASSSPTLERRHDFHGYRHEHSESNAIASRAPHVQQHAHNTATTDFHSLSYPTIGSTPGPRHIESSRHGSLGMPLHDDAAGRMYPQTSTAPPMTSTSLGSSLTGKGGRDDPMDTTRPARRRTEAISRAPVRTSRCVGQREIPGEGLCYIYEDGNYIRAVIDGEPVNPSWGITKAGKPRKRLAQACLTCREKKIKCEPGYPKCHQCAKSQRVCRGGLGMSNASGETSPSSSAVLFKTPSTELVSPVAGHDKSRAFEEQRDPSRTTEAWSAAAASPFRARNFRPTSVATSRDMSVHSADSDWSGSIHHADPDDPRRGSHQDQLGLQWELDPYETDGQLTMHLLDLYFLHAGRATYGMFPRQPFLKWVETNRQKTPDQLMLLYSVLAMGSIFSRDPEHKALGKRFAAIAAYATEKRFGKFTLQLCQSRLTLALFNFSLGRTQEAWDFCGAGLRALSALKLNTEQGIRELFESSPEAPSELEYGLDRRTLEECCRRTFWAGFLMDRYNGFCGGTMCVISIEDTFVHLPCPEDLYEACQPCDTPLFDFDLLAHQVQQPIGYMGYLTIISAIWGEVLTFTSRATHRHDDTYSRIYGIFYAKTTERLDAWSAMLPASLQYSPQNLNNSIIEGHAANFISLHALYHTTVIRLNRHIRGHALPTDIITRNIECSFRHATHFLSIMSSLMTGNCQSGRQPLFHCLLSTPFPGYALMLCVDVLSSGGTVSMLPTLIDSISSTIPYVEELAAYWASAQAQQRAIQSRLTHLIEIARQEEQGAQNGSFGQFWRLPEPLETVFGSEDAVYKAADQLLFEVIGKLTGS